MIVPERVRSLESKFYAPQPPLMVLWGYCEQDLRFQSLSQWVRGDCSNRDENLVRADGRN